MMNERCVNKVVVLGAGSAGLLAAVAFRRRLSNVRVTVVRSVRKPVIGVGESTTAFLPRFLHDTLGLDRKQFYEQVRPSWKLGIRFLWGDPAVDHFNYTFDTCFTAEDPSLRKTAAFYALNAIDDVSRYWAVMDRDRSPCIQVGMGQYAVHEGGGYHIPNRSFLQYLEGKCRELGVEFFDGDVVEVPQDSAGYISGLKMEDGTTVEGDLFVDSSGFESILLGKVMGTRYIPFSDSLFCDSAVLGSWSRDGLIHPYTTSETMDHGWAWRIEFRDHVTRGYVFSSAFCTVDEAMRELKAKNPQISGDMKSLKFPSGRYECYWVKNVVGIGNASGFVEPLEATALHLIAEQLWGVTTMLRDGDGRIVEIMQTAENGRFARMWDEVRDFLAIHYKFNRWSDSPFWRHCRAETKLRNAEPLVEFYRDAGPSRACEAHLPGGGIFGLEGWLAMLIGQRVETSYRFKMSGEDERAWEAYRARIRADAAATVPVREGLEIVDHPNWRWPTTGV